MPKHGPHRLFSNVPTPTPHNGREPPLELVHLDQSGVGRNGASHRRWLTRGYGSCNRRRQWDAFGGDALRCPAGAHPQLRAATRGGHVAQRPVCQDRARVRGRPEARKVLGGGGSHAARTAIAFAHSLCDGQMHYRVVPPKIHSMTLYTVHGTRLA